MPPTADRTAGPLPYPAAALRQDPRAIWPARTTSQTTGIAGAAMTRCGSTGTATRPERRRP
jgi:hypothetical protein